MQYMPISLFSLFLATLFSSEVVFGQTALVEKTNAALIEHATTLRIEEHLNSIPGMQSNVGDVEDRHPYLVLLSLHEGYDSWRCAGTLVAPDVVLSSAHCMPLSPEFMGDVTIAHEKHPYNFAHFQTHPFFGLDGYPDYDIALVKLGRGCHKEKEGEVVKLNDGVEYDGEDVTLLVWEEDDITSDSNKRNIERRKVLKRESLNYIDTACEPWRSRQDLGSLNDNMICSRTGDKGENRSATGERIIPSNGDSGGPLLRKGNDTSVDVQVGVISFGYNAGPGEPIVPTVHARVSAAYGWIMETVTKMSDCSV